MTVFFINPPRINPEVSSFELPLGVVTLLSSMEQQHPEIACQVVDLQLYPELDPVTLICDDQPVICMTILTYNKNIVYGLCEKLRAAHPNAVIILGGPHATLQKDKVFLECDAVDYVSIGEGDFALPQLLAQLYSGNSDCSAVPGAIRKDGMAGPANRRIEDLSVLPSITLGMKHYDMQKVIKRNTYVSYIASRGCPFDCIYCSSSNIWGHLITFVDSQTVCNDLQWLADQGVKYINFRDDIFTLKKKWLAPVLEKLKQLHIIWGCETRADCVDRNTLTQMKDAGCELIRFGVETFNQHTLDALNKRTDVEQVKQSIRDALAVGITEIRLSMMLGLPGEADADVENTLKTCGEFPGVFFKFFSLYPTIGTELYNHLEKYGVAMLASEALIGHSQIHTTTMDNQRINYWIEEAHRQFHDPEEDFHRDFSIIFNRGL